jgi:hypothetical protein
LIIAINDSYIQELFAAAGIKTTTLSSVEALETPGTPPVADSPILPQRLFQAQTSGDETRSDKRKKRKFRSITSEPVEEEAFEFTKEGKARKNTSGKAAQMAKSRQVSKIRNAILNSGLSCTQQIVALRDAANHPQLRSIVKSAGLVVPDESEVALFHDSQRK